MMKYLALVLTTFLLQTRGIANEPPELAATTFRFLRTESKTFPPATKEQRPVTVLYGIFSFRHSQPQPLRLAGFEPPSKDGRFFVRYPGYKVQVDGFWQNIPVGYCAFGTIIYELAPATDYLLLIPVDRRYLAGATAIRVSADAESGIFWSEAFSLPKTKK